MTLTCLVVVSLSTFSGKVVQVCQSCWNFQGKLYGSCFDQSYHWEWSVEAYSNSLLQLLDYDQNEVKNYQRFFYVTVLQFRKLLFPWH